MSVEFPPNSLRQYALIADGERGALVGPHGDLAFLCAPRWHDDAVFSALIGGSGVYAVTPVGRYVWGGSYLPGSLVWRHEWATAGGSIIECRDAMARPAEPESVTVLRRVHAAKGSAAVHVVLDLRAGFGGHRMVGLHRDDTGAWSGTSGDLLFRWDGAGDAIVDTDGRLRLDLHLAPDTKHDLVLQIGPHSAGPADAEGWWRSTLRAWADIPDLSSTAAPRDARHALAVLTGLTSSDGGSVAAATMSLPEHEGGGTNYDYRYAWIRDQAHCGIAASALGDHPLVTRAADFVAARLHQDGSRLKPAYCVDGSPVPAERRLDRSGYPGAADVVGNHAGRQFQLDAFGEALQLLAAAERVGLATADHRTAADICIDAIAHRWTEPDAGIWELDDRHWSESGLTCVAGLRQTARLRGPASGARLDRLADLIHDRVVRTCWDGRGFLRRSPDDPRVDAAILVPMVRGAFGAQDHRATGTLERIRYDLLDDFYVYRYADEDGSVGRREGAFLLCGFMYAMAEFDAGNRVTAFRAFERNRASCGPPGLLSEEFDVEQRQLRGNLPQAFVHAALLDAAVRLGD